MKVMKYRDNYHPYNRRNIDTYYPYNKNFIIQIIQISPDEIQA